MKSLLLIKLNGKKNNRTLLIERLTYVVVVSHDHEAGQLIVNSLTHRNIEWDPIKRNKKKDKNNVAEENKVE